MTPGEHKPGRREARDQALQVSGRLNFDSAKILAQGRGRLRLLLPKQQHMLDRLTPTSERTMPALRVGCQYPRFAGPALDREREGGTVPYRTMDIDGCALARLG